VSRFKTLLAVSALLFAFLLGGSKAALDYWLHETFKQTAQSLAEQQQLGLQTQAIRLVWPAALQFDHVQVSSPDLPQIRIETLLLQPLYQILDTQQLPAEFFIDAHNITVPIPDRAVTPPVILMATGYDRYFLSPADLHQLGYQALQAELAIKIVHQAADQLNISAELNAYAWGQWSLNWVLGQMPPPAEWTADRLNRATLVQLSVRYQDRGLITRLLNFIAQRENMTLDRVQERLLNQLRQDLNRNAAPPFVFQSLSQLIQQPDALVFRLTPPKPIPLGNIARLPPEQLRSQLGFSLDN
jgi:hypothetical protein